jgi:hypothetical protein
MKTRKDPIARKKTNQFSAPPGSGTYSETPRKLAEPQSASIAQAVQPVGSLRGDP